MKRFCTICCLSMLLAALSACEAKTQVLRETYRAAQRQEAPEPTYNRASLSYLPGPIPPQARSTAPLMRPTAQETVKDQSAEKAKVSLPKAKITKNPLQRLPEKAEK